VSAAEGDVAEEKRCDQIHKSFQIAEVVEIDTEANTILVQRFHPKGGEDEGNAQYVLITYDDETTIKLDREESDESAIKIGDKIHARGPVGLEGLVIYKYILKGDGNIVSEYTGRKARKFLHKKTNEKWQK